MAWTEECNVQRNSPVSENAQHAPLRLVQRPDALNDRAMPLMIAMGHIQPGNVHAVDGHDLQHLLRARGRTDCGYDLCAPCTPETCNGATY